jgi:hypothetical protein
MEGHTSGTMIVDGQGQLVGLVWGVSSPVGAGYGSAITPAPVIVSLLKYAFDRDGIAYTAPDSYDAGGVSAPPSAPTCGVHSVD